MSFDSTETYSAVKANGILHIYKEVNGVFKELPGMNPTPADEAVITAIFHPTEQYLLSINMGIEPLYRLFKMTEGSFSLSSSSWFPGSYNSKVIYNSTGEYFAAVSGTNIEIYKQNSDSIIKVSSFSAAVPPSACCFNHDGTLFVYGHNITTPRLNFFKREGEQFVPLSNISIDYSAGVNGLGFDRTGKYFAVAGDEGNGITIYETGTEGEPLLYNAVNFSDPSLGDYGFSLETKQAGEVCRANLFPAINQINQ